VSIDVASGGVGAQSHAGGTADERATEQRRGGEGAV
jgi:hypothetical protein